MSGATPARVTRSRNNTPLPAIPSRQSHAYGARGKAALEQQVTTSTAELNAAFSQTARPRGSTRPPSQSATPAPAKKQKPRRATTPIVEEDDEEGDDDEPAEEDDDEVSRPSTAIQHSAAYINMPAVPPTRPNVAPPNRTQVPNVVDGNDEDLVTQINSVLSDIFLVVPRFLHRLFGRYAIIVGILLVSLVSSAFLSPVGYYVGAGIGATRDYHLSWVLQQNYNTFKMSQLFSDEIQKLNTSEMQWAINSVMLRRIETLEANSTIIKQELALYQAMVDELQSILPNTIVMADDNGEYTIPPLFWKALSQKMESPDASPIWQRFLETNAQQLQTMSQEVFAGNFEEMAKSGRVISHEDFNAKLSEHSQALHDDLEQTARKFKLGMLQEARNAAVDVIEKSEIMSLARAQIAKYSHLVYAHNIDHKLRQVNYFGVGLGAMIDPYYTSKTKNPATPGLLSKALHKLSLARQYPHPPSMALTAWTEATEAWCSETSTDEKAMAQLTVKTAHKIYPTEITIEHIPSTGTRDSSAAPRDFEVWAQVSNATEAKRINAANSVVACKGKAPKGERTWVCLAADSYDIKAYNFVQAVPLYNSQDLGVVTERIALRVVSNWGAQDHTCLYRVLAAGIEA